MNGADRDWGDEMVDVGRDEAGSGGAVKAAAQATPDLSAYFEEASGWDRDRRLEARQSARRAWWVAGGAGVVAVLAVGAVLALTPLKSTQPYVIRVDNSTGIVDIVPALERGAEPSELVTRFLLNGYVTARERYVYAMAESDYGLVGASQSPALNQQWAAAWDRANPSSPLNLYRDGTTIRVQVKAISFLVRSAGAQDMAQVRFLTGTRIGGGGPERVQHWIATLQYTYRPPSKDPAQRSLNPLGFRVLEYRKEPEVLPAPEGAKVAQQGPRGGQS